MVGETNFEQANAPQVGDIVKGKIEKVEEKRVCVKIGDNVEGIIPISELSSLHVEKASDVVSVDEEVELEVIKVEENQIVLSKKRVEAKKAWVDLQEKFASKEIIEVEVKDIVNGGLVVDVGVRGFIPASLVERHFVESFDDYKGKTLQVKVVELDQEKNRVILSHRAVLDEKAEQNKKETLQAIEVGQVTEGKVQRLTDFGAFVDIGGIDGLVHISEMAHYHVEKPEEVVQEGDTVQVKVLKVDVENERVSLSIKETQPGPWETVGAEVKQGDIVEGTVARLVSFGAFVEIKPGVEGLVHISQLANRHVQSPSEVLKEGQTVKAKVLEVHPEEKRISLSIRALEEEKESPAQPKQVPVEEEIQTGFSIGDMIGEQLKKLK
ncbi:30S ribosomal protein S1 [Massilibacterium senegalense]|uniref:30S ribosomal protein S1 n=1 Tax=Massilibacterium senegalense TaxID=1632858 RepID=UPI000780CB15|nr:30S ribosomal protein S1 [Massilibacterium senegalense]